MKRHDAVPITITVLTLAILLLPASLFGQATGVAGAGAGTFPAHTAFSGVSLSGLKFAMGVLIPGGTTADGQLQAPLLGTTPLRQPRNIEVEGDATNGTLATGSRTFSGTATVDMGDGTPPLLNVPFTVTATATGLVLALGATNLPAATLTAGTITIK